MLSNNLSRKASNQVRVQLIISVSLKFPGPVFYVLFTFVNFIAFKFFLIIYCSYILIFNKCNPVHVKINHIMITMITTCNSVFQDLSRKGATYSTATKII